MDFMKWQGILEDGLGWGTLRIVGGMGQGRKGMEFFYGFVFCISLSMALNFSRIVCR